MSVRTAFLSAMLATFSVSSTAAIAQTLSEAEQSTLRDNLDPGTKLYEYDQAAWHTTDTLVADLPKDRVAQIRGWVVTEEVAGRRASYFGRDGGLPYLIYSAVWDGSKVTGRTVIPAGQRPPLSAIQLGLVAALDQARPIGDKVPQCNRERRNTVVIPGRAANDPISVYFLTPPSKKGGLPFGGHYRVDVKDGQVVGQRAFARSCLEMSVPNLPSGAKPVAMGMSHLLDPIPTEIHAFNLLSSRFPLMVIVPDKRIYAMEISGGVPRVRLISRTSSGRSR